MLDQTNRAIFCALTTFAACTPPDTLDVESTEQAGTEFNGVDFNGVDFNGVDFNGTGLSTTLLWTSLEGVVINGTTLDTASLSATVFSGSAGATQLTGSDFAGAEFQGMRGSNPITVRIASTSSGSKWTYFVEYLDDDEWYPLCKKNGVVVGAYPLNGRWNYQSGVAGGGAHIDDDTKFTFACTTVGGLGKCVNDGYEPWVSPTLANHHQACVRMLRADYCGNGTTYTTNGRLVNLYDNIGIQADTEDFGIEAEWDQNGARCFTSHRRAPEGADIPCYDPALEPACGQLDHFQSGTLIMNEIP